MWMDQLVSQIFFFLYFERKLIQMLLGTEIICIIYDLELSVASVNIGVYVQNRRTFVAVPFMHNSSFMPDMKHIFLSWIYKMCVVY